MAQPLGEQAFDREPSPTGIKIYDLLESTDALKLADAYTAYVRVFGADINPNGNGGWGEYATCKGCNLTFGYHQFFPELDIEDPNENPILKFEQISHTCPSCNTNAGLDLVHSPESFMNYLQDLKSKDGVFLVYENNGDIQGFISGYTTYTPDDIWRVHGDEFTTPPLHSVSDTRTPATAREIFLINMQRLRGELRDMNERIIYVADVGLLRTLRNTRAAIRLYDAFSDHFYAGQHDRSSLVVWTATFSKIHSLMEDAGAQELFPTRRYNTDRRIFGVGFVQICQFLGIPFSMRKANSNRLQR